MHDDYQRAGLGSQLLELAERRADGSGVSRLYTLTTRTSHWFLEHGFSETADFELPEAKLANYNPDRRSKILVKTL